LKIYDLYSLYEQMKKRKDKEIYEKRGGDARETAKRTFSGPSESTGGRGQVPREINGLAD